MEPFIGQIIMFAGNFAPRGWALCDGQLLNIADYTALFSILGTTYGGDGRTTFALPDLRGRAPIHAGTGPGLSPATLGAKAGAESVTLSAANLPQHHHGVAIPCNSEEANTDDPADKFIAVAESNVYANSAGTNETLAQFSTASVGDARSFSVQNPHLTVNFIVALQGTYPSRS